jgi:hypothetical protein
VLADRGHTRVAFEDPGAVQTARYAARSARIDAVPVPGLSEPITLAVPLGESSKSVDDLIAGPRGGSTGASRSALARERILDILEGEGDQESDALDARVAKETGLSARTVRNLRMQLATDGLVKSQPMHDEPFGPIVGWKVGRTAAPRP